MMPIDDAPLLADDLNTPLAEPAVRLTPPDCSS